MRISNLLIGLLLTLPTATSANFVHEANLRSECIQSIGLTEAQVRTHFFDRLITTCISTNNKRNTKNDPKPERVSLRQQRIISHLEDAANGTWIPYARFTPRPDPRTVLDPQDRYPHKRTRGAIIASSKNNQSVRIKSEEEINDLFQRSIIKSRCTKVIPNLRSTCVFSTLDKVTGDDTFNIFRYTHSSTSEAK